MIKSCSTTLSKSPKSRGLRLSASAPDRASRRPHCHGLIDGAWQDWTLLWAGAVSGTQAHGRWRVE